MAERDLVIGLDSSTTACKAVVWDRAGNALAVGRAPLPMVKPRPAWHEQPADSWWDAAVRALRDAGTQIDLKRVAALCITAQRETFVIADSSGEPLDNALIWMDERSRELLPEIDRIYGAERFHNETGKPLSANLSVGKLFWYNRHRPELFSRIAQVLDVHGYLALKLTGKAVTSQGCADPMGLFDMRANQWNAPLIEAIGARMEWFPEVAAPGEVIGRISAQAAAETGLPEGVLLVSGLGDGQAAGLAVCAGQPGASYLNLGTAVVTGTHVDRYMVDPAFRTVYGGIPGTYLLETVLLGGTYTVSWFVDQFAENAREQGRSPESILEEAARELPPGVNGLTLVPYWNTVMNPYWDASASGIMVGWRGIHGKAHFYRAILEGIAMELRLHTEGVERAAGLEIERYIAVGGGARSSLWCQIIADVTGKHLFLADTFEASALGAGILAAAGAGMYDSPVSAGRAMARIQPQPFLPDEERGAFYHKLYSEVYCSLYPALRGALGKLADLVESQYSG